MIEINLKKNAGFRKFWIEQLSLEPAIRKNILKWLIDNGKEYEVSIEDIEFLKQLLDDDIAQRKLIELQQLQQLEDDYNQRRLEEYENKHKNKFTITFVDR